MNWTVRVVAAGAFFPDATASLAAQLPHSAPSQRSGQLQRMDRLCGLALCTADHTLLKPEVAGQYQPDSTAVVLGTSYGCHKTDEDFLRGVLANQPSPRLFAYTLPSSPVGEVSIQYGLRGPGFSIVSGRT